MVIWITNYKWGVGKSTICQNIAVHFAKDNNNVCIVDTDINQSSLNWYSLRSPSLPEIPVFFAPNKQILSKIIKTLKNHYKIILIDGTPSDVELTDTIIKLSWIILIPVLPSLSDTIVTKKLVSRIKKIQETLPQILVCRFILNQSTKTNNNKEALVRMSQLSFPILSYHIKNKVIFKRAYETGKGVIELKEKEMIDTYVEVNWLIDKVAQLEALRTF